MKLPFLVLAAAAATLAAAPAQAQLDPTVRTQLDSAAVLMRGRGHTLKQQPVGGTLGAGAQDTKQIQLTAGSYVIVGTCDQDCSDLDMMIADSNGSAVASDMEADDVPMLVVEVPADATYTLTVQMASCSTSVCHYGFSIFGS